MNILTFDLEDWYNGITKGEIRDKSYTVVPVFLDLLSILERFKVKPTFFVVASFAEKNPDLVYRLAQTYDIGSHGYAHRIVGTQTKTEFYKDIVRSVEVLEQITDKKITKYRAPAFSIPDKEYLKVLFDTPIQTDCSLSARDHFYGTKQIVDDAVRLLKYNGKTIKEFPPSVIHNRILGDYSFLGGGYYRLLPYFVMKNRLKDNADYHLMYLHPSDFETNLPKMDGLSLFGKFRRRVGIHNSKKKMLRLLSEFSFTDIAGADKEICWDEVKIMNL